MNLTDSERWLLLGAFMDDVRVRLTTLEGAIGPLTAPDKAVRAQAARTIDDAAHSIRGAAMTIGMHRLASLAVAVEQQNGRVLAGEPDAVGGAAAAAAGLLEPLRALAASRLGGSGTDADRADGTPAAVVLHIEDNASNLKLVELVLEQRPALTLVEARTGAVGLVLAEDLAPDLVLLDLRLPDISGHEVLRQIRPDPTAPRPRVVVVSAEARPAEADRVLAAGAHGYLVKPIDIVTLLETVDDAVVKARS